MSHLKLLLVLFTCLPTIAWAQDTTPPTVAITSTLSDQDRVGGFVTIEADASDDIGVTSVKFFKGNTLIDTDQDAPFTTSFDFNADPPDQDYQIKVTASDLAGNEQNATLTVNKPKHDFRPPGCTLADNGAFFKVWAPHAQKISVIGDFNQWSRDQNFLWNKNGWWFGFQHGVQAGQKYRFAINDNLEKADPYGRQMEHSAGASIVKDAKAFTWTDGSWETPRFENMVIYELHVGTYVGKNDGQSYPGNFRNLLTKLDYIKSLGANMIEIMPVHEVPGPDSGEPTPYLGYSPTGLFAVESSYGGGSENSYDDLKTFVDTAHSKGLGVILDVVYNHFSNLNDRDNWYRNYDGDSENNDGGIYFNGQGTQWGIAPDWGRNEVRGYIEDNCKYWLSEFHFDGLRWDFTGEIKNKPSGWQAMKEIVWNLRSQFTKKIMICENLPYEKEVVESGNFHSGWWVDFHHKLQKALQNESGADLGEVKSGINGGDYSHVTKRVIYAMSHDEARNGGKYLVSEFGGRGSWDARAKARAAAAMLMMSPGIPMIWQGEEFAQDGKFEDKREHAVNWSNEQDVDGGRMKALYRDAIKSRWDHEAARLGSLAWTHEDGDNKVIAFRRDWGDDHLLVVINFSPNSFGDHSYGVHAGMSGQWTQILCSQDSAYGGWDGAGNAFHEPTTQDDGKININLPKFGVIVMKRK